MHRYIHCSIIYNCQDLERVQVSIEDKWIKTVVHLYNGILVTIKAWDSFSDIMGLPGEHYAR